MSENNRELIVAEEINDETTQHETENSSDAKNSIVSVSEISEAVTDDNEKSLVDVMYDKINEFLGGDNANQYFCMTFPGTILSLHIYSYDYQNNQPNPPAVEANESRLASKLFAPVISQVQTTVALWHSSTPWYLIYLRRS